MKKMFSSLYMAKKLLAQFALVFTAFLIMVLIGSVFGTRIVNKNIVSYGKEAMNSSVETLKAYLNQYKITLDDISFSIESIKNEGADQDAIYESIISWTDYLLERDGDKSFMAVYGVVDDVFLHGGRWIPPDDYVPSSRVWYGGALEENGEVFYSDPYIDAWTGEMCVTVSKVMCDKDGKPFGIIAIDVYITSITEYVGSLRLMDSGYGVLLDTNRTIVVHPDSSLIGTLFEDINGEAGGYADIASQLAIGKEISAFQYTDYTGAKSVAFFEQLFNGWYVGTVSPSHTYYSDVYTMIALLSGAGVVLVIILWVVLAFLHIEKHRSDEANKMKTSFLANMSHEIRTPMNAIIGMTELLVNESLTNRQQTYVNDISVSSHGLMAIINDILDLSKIESGKLELSPTDYDFHLFMDNISSMYKYVAQRKGLDFKFELEGEMPKCLFGDDIRLRQVLINICGNAVKFTNQGFIRLKVTTAAGSITFEIEDTGTGIRKDDADKLFDPFARSDSQKSRYIVGTELGLSISKNFIEMMGGTVSVKSDYGQGTIITITIPRIDGNENAIMHEDKEKKNKAFIAPSAKVLVVDDTEVNLKVASGLLKLYHINVQTVFSGMEAIDMVKNTDFDIVFMDHMMPEMDGVEATKEIRKLGGKYKHLPVIALTANAVHGAKEMFMTNGLDDFISKPIDVNILAEMLRKWLPAEKIEEYTERLPPENAGADIGAQDSFLDSVKKISMINTEIGMSRVSGMEDMYRETVELFNKKLLSECDKMAGFLTGGDLHNLAISVHGMKSSLATIGAMELSETAFALEKASKNEELSYCEEHLPGLLEKLRGLHGQLSAVIPNEEAAIKKARGDTQYLRENIQLAVDAANDFDGDLASEVMSRLLEYDFGAETNELLEDANNSLKDFDFDTALDSLNNLKEKI